VGAHARVANEELSKKSFKKLKKGKSAEFVFDVADLYDIHEGGNYTLKAQGAIPWATKKSTKIIGSAPFNTNELNIKVDRIVKMKTSQQKMVLESDCVDGRLQATKAASAVCSYLAENAASAARWGDPAM
jgi:deuterolysin